MDYLSSSRVLDTDCKIKDEEIGACVSTIEVAVIGRGIKVMEGYDKPSAGDVNTCSVSLTIEGGGVWDSLPRKRVTFYTRTASVTVDYAPVIVIPHEVMASSGELYLTLTGYDADGVDVARTNRMTCPIEVAGAGADEGANPTPATLDVVSRIDALAADLDEKRATDYWRGEQGPQGPAGDKGDKGDHGEPGAPGKDGSDATATDVRINGKSITVDGVADIPLGARNAPGVVGIRTDGYYGILLGTGNNLFIQKANINEINSRKSEYKPIMPASIDYAVKAAMCDGNGKAWTAAEQAAAKKRMGVTEGAFIWGMPYAKITFNDLAKDDEGYFVLKTSDLEVIYPAPSDKKIPDGNDIVYFDGYILYGLVDADSTKCRFQFA